MPTLHEDIENNLCLASITNVPGEGIKFCFYAKVSEENAKIIKKKVLPLFKFTNIEGTPALDPMVLEEYRSKPLKTMRLMQELELERTKPQTE
jgi:hypothetical protein